MLTCAAYGIRLGTTALTASYIARCKIASVIGVLSGAIALAVAAPDAVTLHSLIGSTVAAGRVPRERHIHVVHATTNILRVMVHLPSMTVRPVNHERKCENRTAAG